MKTVKENGEFMSFFCLLNVMFVYFVTNQNEPTKRYNTEIFHFSIDENQKYTDVHVSCTHYSIDGNGKFLCSFTSIRKMNK